MICESFNSLTHKEKVEMIGKITHLIQTDEAIFKEVSSMISFSEIDGDFNNVKFSVNEYMGSTEATA